MRALTREIAASRGGDADTLYFGGGTPSLLPPKSVARLVAAVRERYRLATDSEVTLEANPADLSPDSLSALLQSGVNRLSLGVQSLDPHVLVEMGRDHSAEAAREAARAARRAGFSNLSLDLILGWPGETRPRFLATLEGLLELRPDHVSVYVLETEGRTALSHDLRRGALSLPDDDLVADLFVETEDRLRAAGLPPYEISNFARPGFESRHNLKYWDDGPFHAFGLSAHGYEEGVRYWNEETFGRYCAAMETKGSARAGERRLSPSERVQDAVMTGLRRRAGVDLAEFRERHGVALLHEFGEALAPSFRAGLLEVQDGALRLTSRGVLLSNDVLGAIL